MRLSRLFSRSLKQNLNALKMRVFPFKNAICHHDPETLMIFVTNRCNFNCNTCPFTNISPWSPPQNVPDIPVELFSSIVDNYSGAKFIGIVGGEPMLHPDLDKLIRIAAARKIGVNISTNGSLLSENKVNQLLDLPISSLNISIDAVDEHEFKRLRGGDSRTYQAVVKNAERFGTMKKSCNPSLSFKLSFVTDSHNLDRIPECFDLARSVGADTVFCQSVLSYQCSSVTSGDGILWDIESHRHYLQTVEIPDDLLFIPPLLTPKTADHDRTASCIHPFKILAADGAGNLSPCCVIPPHKRFGNICDDVKMWRRGTVLTKFRSDMLSKQPASENICLECWERFSMRPEIKQ
jgi:MoaA/NifB/PqqE/SkfB family radical SAM enzyme